MFLEISVVCGLLVLFYSVYRYFYAPYQVWKRYGIKGPTPVPFFGNYREEAKMTILKYYESLHQEYGSVAGFYIGRKPNILITDLDMLKQIMVKDFSNFMDHETGIAGILPKELQGLGASQGEAWRTKRQILTPTFSSSKMKMMTPLIKKSADILVELFGEKAKHGESFEFFKTYGAFTMETILATAFGRVVNVQQGESNELTKAAHNVFRQLEEGRSMSGETVMVLKSNFPWLTPFFRFRFIHYKQGENYFQLQNVALELVKARRESGKKFKDMLQLMIDATGEEREDEDTDTTQGQAYRNEGKLADKEVVAQAIGILLAGYETTANALAYTSYLLALYPDIQDKLQSEIDSYFDDKPTASVYDACQDITYLDNVIQESLRLYPPAPRTNRLCLKTTIVKGVTIPKGCNIIIPSLLLHKNPLYWKNPEKFDPDRFTPEERAKRPQLAHMPFGFGPRSCIGMRFALLEAKIALMELLKKYTFVRAPDTEVPLQTVLGITMAPKNGIYLKVIHRFSC